MSADRARRSTLSQVPRGESATADDDVTHGAHRDPIELRVVARLDNLAVIRTFVGALATLEDLDLDAVADLRLALDEACTALIRSAAPGACLTVTLRPRPADLLISASVPAVADDVLRPGTFSWHVITSLTDGVETFHDGAHAGGDVFGITMTARRPDAGR